MSLFFPLKPSMLYDLSRKAQKSFNDLFGLYNSSGLFAFYGSSESEVQISHIPELKRLVNKHSVRVKVGSLTHLPSSPSNKVFGTDFVIATCDLESEHPTSSRNLQTFTEYSLTKRLTSLHDECFTNCNKTGFAQ
jgi:hypothetical protein